MTDRTYISMRGNIWELQYLCPPIPVRNLDWEALPEGYDEGDEYATGETVADAITEIERIEDEQEADREAGW